MSRSERPAIGSRPSGSTGSLRETLSSSLQPEHPSTRLRVMWCAVLLAAAAPLSSASAGVTLYWGSPETWQSDAGEYSTVDFTDVPNNSVVTTQYSHLGVTFTEGDDRARNFDFETFLTDGAGLDGNLSIGLSFAQPMNSLAMDYPGGMRIKLFSGGTLFYTSPIIPPGSGVGNFAGIVSTQSFDTVLLYDWLQGSDVYLDNLHFGAPIPAPSAATLLSLAGLGAFGQRRRTR